MAFLGKYMKKYVFSGENTHKALLLVNQWNKKRKRNFGSGWSLPWLSSSLHLWQFFRLPGKTETTYRLPIPQ